MRKWPSLLASSGGRMRTAAGRSSASVTDPRNPCPSRSAIAITSSMKRHDTARAAWPSPVCRTRRPAAPRRLSSSTARSAAVVRSARKTEMACVRAS